MSGTWRWRDFKPSTAACLKPLRRRAPPASSRDPGRVASGGAFMFGTSFPFFPLPQKPQKSGHRTHSIWDEPPRDGAQFAKKRVFCCIGAVLWHSANVSKMGAPIGLAKKQAKLNAWVPCNMHKQFHGGLRGARRPSPVVCCGVLHASARRTKKHRTYE